MAAWVWSLHSEDMVAALGHKLVVKKSARRRSPAPQFQRVHQLCIAQPACSTQQIGEGAQTRTAIAYMWTAWPSPHAGPQSCLTRGASRALGTAWPPPHARSGSCSTQGLALSEGGARTCAARPACACSSQGSPAGLGGAALHCAASRHVGRPEHRQLCMVQQGQVLAWLLVYQLVLHPRALAPYETSTLRDMHTPLRTPAMLAYAA